MRKPITSREGGRAPATQLRPRRLTTKRYQLQFLLQSVHRDGVTLIVICAAAVFIRFDHEVYLSGHAVRVTIVFLAVLITVRLRGAGEARWLGLSTLLATGLLFYLVLFSNVMQGLRGDVPDVNAPIWNGRFYVVQGGDNLVLNGHDLTCWARITHA